MYTYLNRKYGGSVFALEITYLVMSEPLRKVSAILVSYELKPLMSLIQKRQGNARILIP